MKLKVGDSYKKDEEITTNFQPSNAEDVINNGFLDQEPSEIESHILLYRKR